MNITDKSFRKTVSLVTANKMHSPREDRIVSRREKGVHEGWCVAAQLTFIVPLVYLMRMTAGQEGHAAWTTQRKRAVRVRKPDALIRQPIQIRSLDNIVARTAHHTRIMLVTHDEQNIW